MIEITFLKGFEVNKTSESKECGIFHFFKKSVPSRYLEWVSWCTDDVYIINLIIHRSHYCCIINRINKSGAKKVIQNIDLAEKRGTLSDAIKVMQNIDLAKKNGTL